MREMLAAFTSTLGIANLAALACFLGVWLVFEIIVDYSPLRFNNLSSRMAHKRREWMLVMAERDLRMIDTAILTGLQHGSAYFGSSAILGIGGCFALLGATDSVLRIYQDLPIEGEFARALWETKVLGLAMIFVYSFFKFGWAHRLFNYCSILIGSVPHPNHASLEIRRKAALQAAEINIYASRHFTAGMRGIFFALAYLGWFIGPIALVISTLFVVGVLIRRQYFSYSLKILSRDE